MVTFPAPTIGYLPVSTVEALIVLTFYEPEIKTRITVNPSLDIYLFIYYLFVYLFYKDNIKQRNQRNPLSLAL